jgi:hypothetical protein
MTEETKKSFAERALDLDHRILASIVIVIISALILKPISIPFPISSYGQQYFDFVESIPPGETIGFMLGDSPSTRPQLEPSSVLTLKILWEKDCKVVIWSDWAISVPIVDDYIALAETKLGRTLEYGVEYVNLGYVAGEETGQAAFLNNIREVVAGVDKFGNSLDDLPIMQGVNGGGDFEYGFFNVACECTEPMYVRQWQMPYGTKLGSINCAMDLPSITLYLATGQIAGTANGLLGSAEMEYLTGNLGLAFGQTMAVSFGGLYFTILVVLGNIFYFMTKARGVSE